MLTALVVASGLGACGGGDADRDTGAAGGDTSSAVVNETTVDDTAGGAAADDGAAKTVLIKGFAYAPPKLEVRSGSRVSVRNEDDAPHTLTADDGSFDTGSLAKGQEAEIVVEATGAVPYHCTIHDYMRGSFEAGA